MMNLSVLMIELETVFGRRVLSYDFSLRFLSSWLNDAFTGIYYCASPE